MNKPTHPQYTLKDMLVPKILFNQHPEIDFDPDAREEIVKYDP